MASAPVGYEIGTVFSALSVVEASSIPSKSKKKDLLNFTTLPNGLHVYSKYMWWVVLKCHGWSFICLPINTYGDKATTKPGIKSENHGIAYDARGTPQSIPGEDPLKAYAFVVEPNSGRTIKTTSRIDFSKPRSFDDYCLASASKIGRIHPDYLQAFEEHFHHVNKPSTTHEDEFIITRLLTCSASIERVVEDEQLRMKEQQTWNTILECVFFWQCCAYCQKRVLYSCIAQDPDHLS